MYIHLKKYI